MSKIITSAFLVLMLSGSVFIDFPRMSPNPRNTWQSQKKLRSLPFIPVTPPSENVGVKI